MQAKNAKGKERSKNGRKTAVAANRESRRPAYNPTTAALDAALVNQSRLVERLGRATALPMVSTPVRAALELASQPTAVAAPWQDEVTEFLDTQHVGTFCSISTVPMFVYRALATHTITPTWVDNGGLVHYEMRFIEDGLLSNTFKCGVNATALPLNPIYLQSIGTASPHLDLYYPRIGPGGRHFFWIDDNIAGTANAITLTLSSAANPTSGFIPTVFRWFDNDVDIDASVGVSAWIAGVCTIALVKPGYIAIELSPGDVGGQSLKVDWQLPGPVQCLAHRYNPQAQQMVAGMDEYRVTASSVLWTNGQAEMYRNGFVAGRTVPRDVDFETYFHPTGWGFTTPVNPFTKLASEPDRVRLEAKNGIYGFQLPIGSQALAFREVSTEGSLSYLQPDPLISVDDYMVVMLDIPETAASARAGEWVFAQHIEFRTDNTFFSTDVPEHDAVSYMQAMSQLRYLEVWHENPSHFDRIKSALRRGASIAGPLLEAISPFLGEFAPVAMGGGLALTALGNVGKGKPKPKTALRP